VNLIRSKNRKDAVLDLLYLLRRVSLLELIELPIIENILLKMSKFD